MLTIFLTWIWPAWRKRPILILSIFIIPITLVIGQVSIPWFTRKVLNALYEKNNIQTQSIFLALTWGLSKIIIRIQIFLSAIPISHFVQDIRALVLKAIFKLDFIQKSQKSPSDWTQLTIDLSKSLEYIYGLFVWNVLPTLGLFSLILIQIYRIHPLFFWIYFGYIMLQLHIMWILRKPIGLKSTLHNQAKNRLVENYTHLFGHNIPLHLTIQKKQILNYFAHHSKDEITSRNALINIINIARLVMDMIAILVFIMIISIMLIKTNHLLIGDLSFIIMTLISTIDKAWSLGQSWCDLQSAFGLILKYQWLAKKTPQRSTKNIDSTLYDLDISIKNLSFSYDGKHNIFSNFCHTSINERIIGICGLPGCGKTTLMSVIYGTHKQHRGGIFFDGINLDDLTIDQRHQLLCLISQETSIYPNLSVYENLKLADPEFNQKKLDTVMKLACCDHWIYKMGIHTSAKQLSNGQRQQICIARAFLNTKPIWLLDEALSALDEQTHQMIMTNVINHPNIKKIVIISHQKRDHILYDGNINLHHINIGRHLSLSEN